MDVFFEYLIIFIVLWVFHYILVIRPKLNNKNSKKGKKNNNITELMYLKKFYKINIQNIDYKSFVYIYNTINVFIITTVYIIVIYLVKNFVLKIVVGGVLLILLLIICYGLLARYYLWKEGKK